MNSLRVSGSLTIVLSKARDAVLCTVTLLLWGSESFSWRDKASPAFVFQHVNMLLHRYRFHNGWHVFIFHLFIFLLYLLIFSSTPFQRWHFSFCFFFPQQFQKKKQKKKTILYCMVRFLCACSVSRFASFPRDAASVVQNQSSWGLSKVLPSYHGWWIIFSSMFVYTP